MIIHDHDVKLAWNYFIIALTMATSFYVPFMIGFSYQLNPILIGIVSFFYFADVIVRMITTYHHHDTGDLVEKRSEITRHYLR